MYVFPLLLFFTGCPDTNSEPPVYSITYDGNGSDGGTVPVDSGGYGEGGAAVVLAPGTLSRFGYEFLGWNTQPDGSGDSYTAGDMITMPAENVTLYARWEYIHLSASVVLNGDSFGYGEEIEIALSVTSYSGKEISVSWDLSPGTALPEPDDPYDFIITLTPQVTTEYSLKAAITDEVDSIVVTAIFTVRQLPFVGTWLAAGEESPAYSYAMDIVGIWRTDSFDIYYLNPGGTEIQLHSAKGTMTLPLENEWFTATQQFYWNGTEWISGINTMYAKYSFTGDERSMAVLLDLSLPPDTAEYTWDFTKLDDSVDSWW